MVIETIKKRRSIRNYASEPIPEKDLYEILSAGLYAPSGKNRQPWRFFIIKNKLKIKQISKHTIYSRFIRNAPILILVYVMASSEYPLEKDMLSVGTCVQNILLAATDMGYGSCVIGELFNMDLQDIFAYRKGCKLACGICIGKPKTNPIIKNPLNLEDFLLISE